ncbi:hypothetical protein NS7_22070, partial [Enterobacter hormaechei]
VSWARPAVLHFHPHAIADRTLVEPYIGHAIDPCQHPIDVDPRQAHGAMGLAGPGQGADAVGQQGLGDAVASQGSQAPAVPEETQGLALCAW